MSSTVPQESAIPQPVLPVIREPCDVCFEHTVEVELVDVPCEIREKAKYGGGCYDTTTTMYMCTGCKALYESRSDEHYCGWDDIDVRDAVAMTLKPW